jgi:PEP-CTERM motif
LPVLTTTDAVVTIAAPNQIGYHFDPGTAHLFEFSSTDVSRVPEPSTWLLGMIGGGAILLGRGPIE